VILAIIVKAIIAVVVVVVVFIIVGFAPRMIFGPRARRGAGAR